ncbi:hypothetical protein OAV45_06330 [Candidatus Poseidoniales archaeon]|nr:hypothetical protein [Candidatus Poseidoniales archaeon]
MNDVDMKNVSSKKPLNAIPIKEVTAAQIKGNNPPKEIFAKRKYGGVVHFKLLIANNQRNTYLCVSTHEDDAEGYSEIELLTYWKIKNTAVVCDNFAHKRNDNARWMDTLVASRIKGGVIHAKSGAVHHIHNWIHTALLEINGINLEETF